MLKVDLRRLEKLTGVVSESVPGGGLTLSTTLTRRSRSCWSCLNLRRKRNIEPDKHPGSDYHQSQRKMLVNMAETYKSEELKGNSLVHL